MSAINDSSPLISAVELNDMLSREDVKVFDIRGRWGSPPTDYYDDYVKGHIPGAVYLDWTTHFLAQGLPIHLAPVASKAHAQKSFEVLGISSEDTVVLYDDYHHMLAGRVWWAMRYWGFSNIKILNGGWTQWNASGFSTSTDIHNYHAGTFNVSEQAHLRASIYDVKNKRENTYLFDARGPINYGGNPSDPTTGHIPGAINIPYSSLLDAETNIFKDESSLTAILGTALEEFDKVHLISSCGSGYAGCVLLIALQTLGVKASLYDGSFSEWKKDGTLKIEQGPIHTV